MAEKQSTVAELKDLFQRSSAVLLTEYRGLTVAQLKQLRVHDAARASSAQRFSASRSVSSIAVPHCQHTTAGATAVFRFRRGAGLLRSAGRACRGI